MEIQFRKHMESLKKSVQLRKYGLQGEYFDTNLIQQQRLVGVKENVINKAKICMEAEKRLNNLKKLNSNNGEYKNLQWKKIRGTDRGILLKLNENEKDFIEIPIEKMLQIIQAMENAQLLNENQENETVNLNLGQI